MELGPALLEAHGLKGGVMVILQEALSKYERKKAGQAKTDRHYNYYAYNI